MKKICFGLVFLFTLFFSFGVNAATYDIYFDDNLNGTIDSPPPPYVEKGTFSFFGDVTNGTTYILADLKARDSFSFSFSFSFDFNNGEIIFTEDNIKTPADQVNVIISDSGQELRFEEIGSPLNYGGSLEFEKDDTYVLTFGNQYDSSYLTTYMLAGNGTTIFYADYIAVKAVPVPAAIWLLGSGLAGLAVMRRKSKK